MHRLLQAGPFKEEVKTAGDGVKLSSKEVVEEHNEHNFEGENSIEATMETPRTRGQQANPMIGASTTKGNKGRNKRKCKRSKITLADLLDKYQKKSEEKNAYRPNHAKKPRSPQGANMRIGIGKVRIFMQHIHILILGRQCRGGLPMLM